MVNIIASKASSLLVGILLSKIGKSFIKSPSGRIKISRILRQVKKSEAQKIYLQNLGFKIGFL